MTSTPRHILLATVAFAILGSSAHASTIFYMDQLGPSATDIQSTGTFPVITGHNSQDRESGAAQPDRIYMDDFSYTAGDTLNYFEAAVLLWKPSGPAPTLADVTGLHIEVFSSVAMAQTSLTGNAGSLSLTSGYTVDANFYSAFNSSNGSYFRFKIPFNMVLNGGTGTYHVGLIGELHSSKGFFEVVDGRYGSQFPAGNNGFDVTGLGVATNTGFNAAYLLNGSPVPEPATCLLLGAGAAFLVRRQRW